MRIGIDIDDTIANTSDKLVEKAILYNAKKGNKQEINFDAYSFSEMFGWTKEEKLEFLKEVVDEVLPNVTVKKDVVRVINELSKKHEIYFITARMTLTDPYSVTKDWLDKYGIHYDKIIVRASEKGIVCRENKIDLFIDDTLRNCYDVKQENVIVWLYDSKYNRNDSSLKRVYNWQEIYELIEKM